MSPRNPVLHRLLGGALALALAACGNSVSPGTPAAALPGDGLI